MHRGYRFRIYPTEFQEQFLVKEIGLCRLAWNNALDALIQDPKSKLLSYKDALCRSKYGTQALEFLKEVNAWPLAETMMHLTEARKNFFASKTGKRKGKVMGTPKFKSKKSKLSFQQAGNTVKFKNGYLDLGRKLGPIKIIAHRLVNGKFKSCTISQSPTNKWYVSILTDQKNIEKNHNGKIVGIDWNCRDDAFLTFSDGTKVKCPRLLKKRLVRLSRKQQTLSRCMKQSKNYEKKRINVAKLHEKISNQRNDFLHKLSRSIVDNYEYVVVEDINLQKMASKLHHGKVIGDQGFGMLRSMIEYKGTLIKVPAPYTSKTCSACGEINENVVVGIEKWTCPNCGCYHDRDINAAKNIERLGRKVLGEPEDFKPVESKVTETTKQEVSSSCMDSKGRTNTRRRRGL